jgi:hypothetical protein
MVPAEVSAEPASDSVIELSTLAEEIETRYFLLSS